MPSFKSSSPSPRFASGKYAGLALSAMLCASPAFGVIYVNETFDDLDDVLGNAPSSPTPNGVLQVTVGDGSSTIGTGQVADFNDAISGGSGSAAYLEYNATPAPVDNLYAQFDFQNIDPVLSDSSGNNSMIFGVGPFNTDSGGELGGNILRALAVELYHDGNRSRLKLRVSSSSVFTGDYDPSVAHNIKVFVNDHDTNTLDYLNPETLVTSTLAANSFAVFLDDTLLGASDAGFGLNLDAGEPGNTTGNATIGRVGFVSTTTDTPHFHIDNLLVTDIVVPEPGSMILLGLGAATCFRRKRAA